MKNINLMNKQEEEIQEEIKRNAQDQDEDHLPIYDGIVNVENYLNAPYRILWILKEGYDYGDNTGGGWKIISCIANDPNKDLYQDMVKNNYRTFEKISYISYSIFNGFISMSEMDEIYENTEIAKSLNSIAYINISKMPATPKSNNSNIAKYYEHWKYLLHRQMQSYRPEIIIFAGTFEFFKNDLFIKDEEIKKTKHFEYILRGETVYFNACHPAYWSINNIEYVSDIIDTLRGVYQY